MKLKGVLVPRLLSLLFCGIFITYTFSQQPQEEPRRFYEYGMQPEVWHFVGPIPATVDNKGDLNLNIPILKVPGTNGLDFEITFTYKAGILYHQTASWIGLGWNFDPGSITRDVQGNIKFESPCPGVPPTCIYGVDYERLETRFYAPDQYYITLPGKGTFPMGRTTLSSFNDPNGNDYIHPYNGQFGFYIENYKPYKIEYELSSPQDGVWWDDYPGITIKYNHDINEYEQDVKTFIITDDDGIRYIFSKPSLGLYKDYLDPSVPPSEYAYPNVWRIVGIAGPDYSGNLDLLKEDVVPYEDSGLENYIDWIKFEYSSFSGELINSSMLIQNAYLTKIITPTHYAEFILDNRDDIDLKFFPDIESGYNDISSHYKRLKEIRLYTKNGTLVKTVQLIHDYELGESNNDSNNGKLTLKRIVFNSYNYEILPGYDFEYVDYNPSWSYLKEDFYYDGYGYYNDQSDPKFGIDKNPEDAKAWSLKKTTYPSGATEEYEYENDYIDDTGDLTFASLYDPGDGTGFQWRTEYFNFDDVWGPYTYRRQGGIRVTQITRTDGMGNNQVIQYSYGPGHTSCVPPPKMVPWLQWEGSQVIYRNEYVINNRGERGVFYEWVKATYSDGSEVIRYYVPGDQATADYWRQKVLISSFGTYPIWLYHSNNNNFIWGQITKQVINRGDYRETIEYQYDNFYRYIGILFPQHGIQYGETFYIWQYHSFLNQHTTTAEQISQPTTKQQIVVNRTQLPLTRQVKSETTTTGEREVKREFTYAHEIYNQTDGMLERNRLTDMAQIDLYFQDRMDAIPQFILEASDIYTYHQVPKWPNDLETVWKVREHYQLNTEEELTAPPAFNNWNGGNTPDPRWQKKYRIVQYKYGKPIVVEDANGEQLELFYGDNTKNLVNSDTQNDFAHNYLTGVRLNNLEKEFDYDTRFLRMNKYTDESDNVFEHIFDNFGRLTGVKDAYQALTHEYAYEYSRQPGTSFDPANPNFIKKRSYFTGTRYADVYEYYDGSARLIQTVEDTSTTGAGNTGYDYYTAIERDEAGREKKLYKPYKKTAQSGRPAYDPDYPYRDENGNHTGSLTDRFRENHYNSLLDEQLMKVDFPGPKTPSNSNFYDYQYVRAKDELPQIYPPDNLVVWRKVTTTDEVGNQVILFEDEEGRKKLQREFKLNEQGQQITVETYFKYDGRGNIVEVFPPNYFAPPAGSSPDDWKFTYEYNTLGQLIAQTTPDAGTVRYKYDALGNLRFHQDVNQRQRGVVGFTTYDFAGRERVQGEASADFDNLDGTQNYPAFEDDADNWISLNHYDSPTLPNQYPWNLYDYSGITLNNTAGRLTANAYKITGNTRDDLLLEDTTISATNPQTFRVLNNLTTGSNVTIESGADVVFKAGSQIRLQPGFHARSGSEFRARINHDLAPLEDAWQITLFSYNKNGLVEAKYVFTPGLNNPTTYNYQYDRQGKLTHVQVQQGSESFHHWYAYGGRDELQRVYTATTATQPMLADWLQEYNPAGLPVRLAFKETSTDQFMLDIPLQYNIRDWLTDISDVNTQTHPFAAHYDYYADGNIQSATFYNANPPQLPNEKKYRYDYTYDPRKQLLSADYRYYAGGWQNPARFDVTGLQYDGNGNILALERKKENDASIDYLTYQYGNNNRLQSVADAVAPTPEDWDAEDTEFGYDANGNVVSVKENGSYRFRHIQYDPRNLPMFIERSDLSDIIYLYNTGGQRVYKKIGSQNAEHYILDGDQTVAVYENGTVKYWNILANGVVGRRAASGEKFYYLKDHLGSTRAVVNSSGTVVEAHDYYPFGLLMPGRDYQSGSETKEKFMGKEWDEERSAYHLGARPLMAVFGRFPSPDRFADEYPSLSPYQYAANNPINFIDVNGDSIWIVYENEEGNKQRLLYTQGMKYEGSYEEIAKLVATLNKLNKIKSGNTILTTLTGSIANYNLGLSGQYGGVYKPNAVQQGSGGNLNVADPSNLYGLAHELFHGYQHENMDLINSTAFEVGARLFEEHIYFQINRTFISPFGGSEEFNRAYNLLLMSQSFNQKAFNTATRTFLQSAFNPPNPPNYNQLQPILIQNPPISRFYPLIKF